MPRPDRHAGHRRVPVDAGYRHSDIDTWTRQFFGPNFHATLTDINVDGGPLAPACPAGDVCPPEFQGFAGNIESTPTSTCI